MSDLTEFLLARVAEDEAAARAWARAYNNPGSHPEYHYATMRRHRREWPVLWRSLDAYPPARILAECEAKRRIVEDIETARVLARSLPGGTTRLAVMHSLDMIDHHLASVYADHPDYRDEWRV